MPANRKYCSKLPFFLHIGNRKDQLNSAEADLEEALTTMYNLTEKGELDTTVDEVKYDVDLNSWNLIGDFDCSIGFAKSRKELACGKLLKGSQLCTFCM